MTAPPWPTWANHARDWLEATAGFVLLHLPPPTSPWNLPRLAWQWLTRKEPQMTDASTATSSPSAPASGGFSLIGATLASAEEMAKIAEEAPVLVPILATGAKTVVDLIHNDAPALVADARTLATDLKAPDAIQAALANDELANLLVQGVIWLEKRVAAAIASAKEPHTPTSSKNIPSPPPIEGQ